MSASLLAAGVSCSGPPDHAPRTWGITAERHLLVSGATSPAVAFGLRSCAIPGDASVLIADPYRYLALLDNGAAFHLDVQHGRPAWRVLGKEADTLKTKDNAPLLAGAWPLCGGGFVLVDREQRISTWSTAGRAELAPQPVPGDGRIVGVDVPSRTVLFASGERLSWFGGGWNRLPGLLDSATGGTVRVAVRRGIALGGARGDIAPGDVLDLPEGEARRLLASGHVEIVPPDADAAA